MVNKITKNNTKAEILAAYSELVKSYSQLEKEAAGLQTKLKKSSNGNGSNGNGSGKSSLIQSKTTDNPGNINEDLQPAAAGADNNIYNIDAILTSLEHLQIGFGSAAGKLSEKLIAEASTLEELRNSVSEAKSRLKELHNLEKIEDNTLDRLIENYKGNAQNYEDELNDRQEALEQKHQNLQEEWRREQEKYKRDKKERDETYQKEQKRAAEEYQYELRLKRDFESDEYEQRKQELYEKLKEQKISQEREWKLREEEIFKRENENIAAQEKVENHAREKEKYKNNGREEGKRIGNSQTKIEFDLLMREIEGDRQNYLLRIETLDQTIKNQADTIKNLTAQQDSTLKQVQNLAVKAIEGSSNKNAFDAIKEVTNELAKNQHKGK